MSNSQKEIIERLLEAAIETLSKELKASQAALAALRQGKANNHKPRLDDNGKLPRNISPAERQRRSDAMTARWNKRKALEREMGADLVPSLLPAATEAEATATATAANGGSATAPTSSRKVKPNSHGKNKKK